MTAVAALADRPKQFPTVKEMAGWVLDGLRTRDYGESIPYTEFTAMCTVSPQENRRAREAVLRAAKTLLLEHQKLLVNERGRGYKIVQPKEHALYSKARRRGGARRLHQSLLAMTHIAFNLLETEQDRQAAIHEQVRSALSLALVQRVSRKRKLPPRDQIAIPSGAELVRFLKKKA